MNQRSNNNLLILDIETSGVNPFRHEVLAIACVPYASHLPPLEIYVRHPRIEWTEFGRHQFAKYEGTWKKASVDAHEACAQLERYISSNFGQPATPVGHNVGFDIAFLRKLAFLAGKDEIEGLSHRAIDTHSLLYVLFDQGLVPESALTSDGAFRFFGITVQELRRHTAIGDAIATRDLVENLFRLLSSHQHLHMSR